ncbi:uncharacterized protein CBL_11366 [Carabus blaptoides fortunei]
MKFAIVAFLCLAVAESTIIVPRRSLGAAFEKFSEENGGAEFYSNINNDVQDFLDLLPEAEIEGIIRNYVQNDEEVKSNWQYVTSDGVQQQIAAIEHGPEFAKLRAQLEGGNLDVARFINMVHDIFGFEHLTRQVRVGNGLRGMLAEIKAIIPMTRIKLLAARKYLFSSAFRKMVKIITSDEFNANLDGVSNSALVQALIADARANGVDVDAITDFGGNLALKYKSLKLEDYDD